jgi:hypothetical protein
MGAAAPTPPLPAVFGFCLADGSLPRATKLLAGRRCRPHIPTFRYAWIVLQTLHYRGQRNTCHHARALAHSYRDHDAHAVENMNAYLLNPQVSLCVESGAIRDRKGWTSGFFSDIFV